MSQEYNNIADIIKQRPVLCASIVATNEHDYFNQLEKAVEKDVDLAELRLDFINNIDENSAIHLISKSKVPLIVTNRNKENGGTFSGDEKTRLSIIGSSIKAKPAFIDIELSTSEKDRNKIIDLAKENNVGVICSYHDFNKTPSETEIHKIYQEMSKTQSDLIKMVFTPHSNKDARTILKSNYDLRYEKIPYTLFGMGKAGQNTRLLSLLLGSCLTYCSIESNSNTQNGLFQISVEEMKRYFSYLENQGWQAIRKRGNEILELSMIELNNDGSYPFKSIVS
ncbi:MAG: type I 3-dehydroquinate dehydratase [Nitrososphaeraceae archaeon]